MSFDPDGNEITYDVERDEPWLNDDRGNGHPEPDVPDAPPVPDAQENGDDVAAEAPAKKSVATVLVGIAQERYEFGVSATGETFGVPRSGAKVTFLLRGGKKSLRAQLAREYFTRTGKAAPQQALADAMLVIEGIAQDDDEVELHLRVAAHGGALWLDLGDQTGRAVRVNGSGWTLETLVPVLFKRTALNSPLPEPAAGGGLGDLWRWLNVEPEDRPLIAAWLVAALFVDVPHPALGLFGEQGTGKSTAMKMLVSIVDPSPVPTRKPPKDAESWVTAAAGSWLVGLDNLSDIAPWLSDSICRAVTGDGDVRRRLYTDADLAVFAYRRCLILNGIDLGGLRGDLADRMLPITMRRIADVDRLDEQELWLAWEDAHPCILGALLDLAAGVAGVAGIPPSVRLATKPRMADFAGILAAVDEVLGTDGLGRYLTVQGALASDSLDGDDFVVMMAATVTTFEGTSAELLKLVTPADDGWRPPKGWPGNARSVTRRLHRQAPVMRKAGWTVEDDGGDNHDKVIRWTVKTPEVGRNPSPPYPRDPQTAGHAGVAGVESGPSQDDDVLDTDEYEADYPDRF